MKLTTLIFNLSLFALNLPATAGLLNGSFESGNLTGWSSLGDVSVVKAAGIGVTPVAASQQALLTTASNAIDGFYFSLKVDANGLPIDDAIDVNKIITFLNNVSPQYTGPLAGVEGSLLSQSFVANAGDSLSFAWDFLTNDPRNQNFNDYAFTILDGSFFLLANTFSNFQASTNSPFSSETGYSQFSHRLTAGSHTLNFGVLDVGDGMNVSALLVDNVTLQRLTVPEPSLFWLLGIGLIAFSLSRRNCFGNMACF